MDILTLAIAKNKSGSTNGTITTENITNALGYKPADQEDVSKLSEEKIPLPEDSAGAPQIGAAGQVLESAGDGTTRWADINVPDGTLTEVKFSEELKLHTIKDYVTPQMFGAVGDGETDDSNALKSAFESECDTIVLNGTYYINNTYITLNNKTVYGNNSTILIGDYIGYEEDIISINGSCLIDDLNITTKNDSDAKHILVLKNCNESIFRNVSVYVSPTPNNTDSAITPLDVNTNNKNILFEKCFFTQMSDGEKGGVWVREGQLDTVTENIQFDTCTFERKNSDEVLAVWGWKGTVQNITVRNSKFVSNDTTNYKPIYFISVGQDGVCKNVTFDNNTFDVYQSKYNIISTINDDNGKNENVQIVNCKFNIHNFTNPQFVTPLFGCQSLKTKYIVKNCEISFDDMERKLNTLFINCDVYDCTIRNVNLGQIVAHCDYVINNAIFSHGGNIFEDCTNIIGNTVVCETIENSSIIKYDESKDDSEIVYLVQKNIFKNTSDETFFNQLRYYGATASFIISDNVFKEICVYISGSKDMVFTNNIINTVNTKWLLSATTKIINYIKNGSLQTS